MNRNTLAILLFLVACMAAVLLYRMDGHVFLYFGDATSHIVRARQFFDSQRPGIDNLGTVWLPLPHLLLLPLVAWDGLFYTGIAGPVAGIPLLVGTGILMFTIVRTITGSHPIAFLSAVLLGLNPNLVYMALTPMNEPSLLFLFSLAGYAFLQWLRTENVRWIVLCAVAVALATLCRYEAWLLAPYVTVVAVSEAIALWRQGRRYASFRLIAIAGVCWVGIFSWLLWNFIEYGDPLKFARWTYSVATPAARDHPGQSPMEAISVFGTAIVMIFGPLLLLASAAALTHLRRIGPKRDILLLLLFFSLPGVFTLTAVLLGFVRVDEWWWNWRYVLTLAPFLSVAGALGLSELFERVRSRTARGMVVAGLLAVPLLQIAVPSVGVATYRDAEKSFNDTTHHATVFGERLRSAYGGGTVALVTGYSQAQRIMVSSWLPLKQFHIMYDPAGVDLTGPLWESDRYVVIGKDRMPESERSVDYWHTHMELLLRHYDIRWEDGHYLMMESKHPPDVATDSTQR